MDINTNSLYAQMQNMSLEAMGNKLPNADMGVSQVNGTSNDFASLLKSAVNSVNDVQQEAGALKKGFELGDSNITLAQTMVASAKAGIAFDATVQVRNKFVEAYKEIMNMPV